MYRDDTCAVCGESLPPDHLYCREHAAAVDGILHRLAEALTDVAQLLPAASGDLTSIHPETWDFLVDEAADDPEAIWPPKVTLTLRVDGDDVDVDIDPDDPGTVEVTLQAPLHAVLAAAGSILARADVTTMIAAAADAHDAGATH